jgi:hypothetical protein
VPAAGESAAASLSPAAAPFSPDPSARADEAAAHELGLQARVHELAQLGANRVCADCGALGTAWAAWNLGVFLCLRCAAVHRNLGAHISKVGLPGGSLVLWFNTCR